MKKISTIIIQLICVFEIEMLQDVETYIKNIEKKFSCEFEKAAPKIYFNTAKIGQHLMDMIPGLSLPSDFQLHKAPDFLKKPFTRRRTNATVSQKSRNSITDDISETSFSTFSDDIQSAGEPNQIALKDFTISLKRCDDLLPKHNVTSTKTYKEPVSGVERGDTKNGVSNMSNYTVTLNLISDESEEEIYTRKEDQTVEISSDESSNPTITKDAAQPHTSSDDIITTIRNEPARKTYGRKNKPDPETDIERSSVENSTVASSIIQGSAGRNINELNNVENVVSSGSDDATDRTGIDTVQNGSVPSTEEQTELANSQDEPSPIAGQDDGIGQTDSVIMDNPPESEVIYLDNSDSSDTIDLSELISNKQKNGNDAEQLRSQTNETNTVENVDIEPSPDNQTLQPSSNGNSNDLLESNIESSLPASLPAALPAALPASSPPVGSPDSTENMVKTTIELLKENVTKTTAKMKSIQSELAQKSELHNLELQQLEKSKLELDLTLKQKTDELEKIKHCHQLELENLKHSHQVELEILKHSHQVELEKSISETKKKKWCSNCPNEAVCFSFGAPTCSAECLRIIWSVRIYVDYYNVDYNPSLTF